jgi:glutamate racemase
VVLACTHFPLVVEELAAAAPRRCCSSMARRGIARRTAWLLRDRNWPDQPGESIALFTRRTPLLDAYRPGLAAFGLARVVAF